MTDSLDLHEKKKRPVFGTHSGSLSPEARARRASKNSRNRAKRGQATRASGTYKKVRSVLYTKGSRRTGR